MLSQELPGIRRVAVVVRPVVEISSTDQLFDIHVAVEDFEESVLVEEKLDVTGAYGAWFAFGSKCIAHIKRKRNGRTGEAR